MQILYWLPKGRLVAAGATGRGSGHLKIAWPVLDACFHRHVHTSLSMQDDLIRHAEVCRSRVCVPSCCALSVVAHIFLYFPARARSWQQVYQQPRALATDSERYNATVY
eukprot:3438742-Pleurochrysis_carterae.AAC.5